MANYSSKAEFSGANFGGVDIGHQINYNGLQLLLNHPKSFTNEMLELSTVYARDDLIEYLLDFHIGMEFSPEAVLKAVLAEILNILQAYINTVSDKMITGAEANLVFEIAAVWGKQESLRFALNHGVDPNAKNKEGRPVIIEALRNGQTEAVNFFLNAGADNSVRSEQERSLLQEAAACQKVLQTRLNFIKGFEGSPAYAEFGRPTTQKLERHLRGWLKAEVNPLKLFENQDFMEALYEDSDHEAMIYTLLAECTSDGETLLHLSITSAVRIRAILQWLKRKHADKLEVDARDKDGRTALHYATAACNARVMQCLIDNGADVLAEDHQQVMTLHFAVGDPSCVSVAIRDGCEVHAFDNLCRTPYHYATLKEETNYKVVDILKRTSGFKPGAVDILRNTAEDYDNQDRNSFIDRFDQTIQWMDRMLSRNSLHDIYVWWYLK